MKIYTSQNPERPSAVSTGQSSCDKCCVQFLPGCRVMIDTGRPFAVCLPCWSSSKKPEGWVEGEFRPRSEDPPPADPGVGWVRLPDGRKEAIHGLALCAGVGGLELGLHLALGEAYRCVGYVEREAYAAAALVARMADQALDPAPVWDDLTTFDGGPWRGLVDLVSAGYPCQPFSVAGKRKGADDPRHLWPHVARIIREVQPRLCFFENVPGHLSMGFEQVHDDLEAMGYRVAAGLFSAEECGAPHRRERLFILANHEDDHGRRGVCGEETAAGTEGVGRRGSAGGGEVVADSNRGEYGDERTRQSRRARLEDSGEELADGQSGGFGVRREPSRRDRQPDGGDQELADLDREGRGLERPAHDGRGVEPGDDDDRCDPAVGDAQGVGVEGNGAGGIEVPRPPAGPALSGRSGRELPLWPPGPGDAAGWARILDARPDLAPSTAQSGLRGVDDGLSPRLDRLRACGNGVVPVVAAKAFRVLAEALGVMAGGAQ